MCRKVFWAGAVLVAALIVAKTTALGGLAQVAWSDARHGLERAVPPEVQLKQLRMEIDKVDQDIKKNLGVLAAQEVEFQALDDNVAGLRELIGRIKADIGGLSKRLEAQTEKVACGRDSRAAALAAKLDNAVATFENKKLELKGKEQLLAAKKQAVDAAHQRVSEMREQKEKLRVTAAKLETRLELVRLKEVRNKVEIDDSQVNRCNTLANRIEARLREKEKLADLQLQYGYRSEVPALDNEPRAAADVLKAARQALAEDEAGDKVAVEGK
jgi:chromosome segregation ATPase